MQLNGGAPGSGFQSEINVTPLVDVVLVLLIIFMVVVPLLVQGYDVETPRTSTSAEAVPAPADEAPVILGITPTACAILEPPKNAGLPADCRVNLGEHEIPAAELPARVKEVLGGQPVSRRVLFLAADDRLNYESVLRIVDLAKSGVEDLAIGVIPAQ